MQVKFLIMALLMSSAPVFAQMNPESLRTTASARRSMLPPTNIYEVNIRQFTPQGTFNAFAKHLPRLKDMGVRCIWLMPIQPIGLEKRKGTLGSYYSIKDYMAVNPEFGTMEDFIHLVNATHNLGMSIIIDWVANHTAWDHAWIKNRPDYYKKDDKGNLEIPFDWTDVVALDYSNQDLRRAMMDAMKFWLRATNIDGFRCDVAELVPMDFWIPCRQELNQIKPIFFLAEGEKPELHDAFDATYSWSMHHTMNDIAKGKKTIRDIDVCLRNDKANFPPNAIRMQFTSNHDENSWNGTEFERLGEGYKAFAALSIMLPGIPLIYTGQEEPLKKRLEFFEKDEVPWKNYALSAFYKELLILQNSHPALNVIDNSGTITRIDTGRRSNVYAFYREGLNGRVLCFFNLSNKAETVRFRDAKLEGVYYHLADANNLSRPNIKPAFTITAKSSHELKMGPWDFQIFVLPPQGLQ